MVERTSDKALTLFLFDNPLTANDVSPEAFFQQMKSIKLRVSATLLSSDPEAFKRICDLLAELEKRGYVKNGEILFDDDDENVIAEIFNRHIDTTL